MTDNELFGISEQLETHDKRTETHACDLISRQAAISHVDDVPYIKNHPNVGLLWKAWIESLPSAQQERKKGRWLPDNRPGGGFWVCSCCKFPSEAFAANVLYKFCPNCGADMRGEQDGSNKD